MDLYNRDVDKLSVFEENGEEYYFILHKNVIYSNDASIYLWKKNPENGQISFSIKDIIVLDNLFKSNTKKELKYESSTRVRKQVEELLEQSVERIKSELFKKLKEGPFDQKIMTQTIQNWFSNYKRLLDFQNFFIKQYHPQ